MANKHRKSKSAWVGDLGKNQTWFERNVKRQRRRAKIAHASRKINQKKARGKK